jgi:hypothetical protein
LLPYTEADVVDSEASGFVTYQVKEQTTYRGGVVVGHQAEELDACLIVRDGANYVAIDIISGDASAGDGIEKAAIESNTSLRSANSIATGPLNVGEPESTGEVGFEASPMVKVTGEVTLIVNGPVGFSDYASCESRTRRTGRSGAECLAGEKTTERHRWRAGPAAI